MFAHSYFTALSILTIVALTSCSKDKNGGTPLGLGQLHIPLKDTAPSGLASVSAVSANLIQPLSFFENSESPENRSSPINTIKERLFQDGPTDFLNRIKSVDDRLAELDKRHQESARKCVDEEPKQWTLTGLPDASGTLTANTTLWLQCAEEMSGSANSTLKVYFGRKDGYSYLAELQTSTGDAPTMAVLGMVDDASTKAEIWQVNITNSDVTADAKKHSSWMRILADKTAQNFEMAVGGTGTMGKSTTDGEEPFSGLGCGVQVKANSAFVYGSGRFYDANSNLDVTPVCQSAATSVCAATETLAVSSDSECSSLSSFSGSLPLFSYSQLKGTGSVASGYTLGESIVTGNGVPSLTSFNEDKN